MCPEVAHSNIIDWSVDLNIMHTNRSSVIFVVFDIDTMKLNILVRYPTQEIKG